MPHTLRFALRRLLRAPGFTAAAVLCLALGIGANTALFTVVNAVLLRPLPFSEPKSLVGVWEASRLSNSERNTVSPANYLDWQAQNAVFEQMAAVQDFTASLTGSGEPEEIAIQAVSASLFSVLGLEPARGRTFTAAEDIPDGPNLAVLSHALWLRRYGADPSLVGGTIQLDGEPYTVTGIMPPGALTVGREARPALWIPIGLDPAHNYRESSGRYLQAVARLRSGVTVERAQTELATVASRLAEAHPEFNSGWSVNLVPITEQVVGQVRRPLALLSGVVLLVLLIACANVANLQLAQASARKREIAVHAVLGANAMAIGRQFLVESLLMSLVGGALGVVLAWWGTEALATLAASSVPRIEEVQLDPGALAFTLGVSLASALAFGLVSAIHAARGDLYGDLKEGARGSGRGRRTRAALVGAQVALSLVLLAGAGLLLKSFARLHSVDLGFNPDQVLTARVTLGGEKYADEARQVRFFQDLLSGVGSLPGVRSAGAINWLPLSGLRSATNMTIEGEPLPPPGEEPGADVRAVDPDFFRTMQIPLLQGRAIAATDTRTTPRAVVVSRSFVERYLGRRDPIGSRIHMPWGDTLVGTVVGIVGDVKHTGVDSMAAPTVYWALPQFPHSSMTLVVRATGDPEGLAAGVIRQVRTLDPNQPVAEIKTFDDWLGGALARRRFSLLLLGGFAGLAVALTIIGLYGTTAYGVSQRTRELGIRLALGASARAVAWGVLRSALAVVLGGVAVGLAGAVILTRLLSTLLFDVSATDPLVLASMTVALLLVGAAASYLPARSATRVDPMVALRSE